MRTEITSITYEYHCDQCEKQINDRKHILIEDAWRIGFVEPPEWDVPHTRSFRRTYQFCNIRCLSKFLRSKDA